MHGSLFTGLLDANAMEQCGLHGAGVLILAALSFHSPVH
jgi:hypothetical protein